MNSGNSPSYGGAALGKRQTPMSLSKHSPKYTSEHSPYSPIGSGGPQTAGAGSGMRGAHSGQPGSGQPGSGGAGGNSSIGLPASGYAAAYMPSGTAGIGAASAYNPASPNYKQESSSEDEVGPADNRDGDKK